MRTITRLQISNFKRIGVVDVTPEGVLVPIAGKNEQGKSSTLDAIACALGGTRLAPARPIREGETEATIQIDTDDGMQITRSWKAKTDDDGKTTVKTTLKVQSADGMKPGSPQRWLDAKIGELSFDPLAFSREKPPAQAEKLRKLTGVDVSGLDAKRGAVFSARSDTNREIKRLTGHLAGLVHHPDVELVDVQGLVSEMAEAQKLEREVDAKNRSASDHAAAAERKRTDAAALRSKAERLRQEAQDAEDAAKVADESATGCDTSAAEAGAAAAAIAIPDTDAIRANIEGAEAVNAKVRANAERDRVGEQLEAAKDKAGEQTEELDSIDAAKANALASADMPVEGLSFDETGITLDGIPFDQASSARKLRVSMAMGLAANPELGVVLIREGSLLDEDSLALVAEMAEAANAQVWVEIVGAGPEGAVVIEDGHVAD